MTSARSTSRSNAPVLPCQAVNGCLAGGDAAIRTNSLQRFQEIRLERPGAYLRQASCGRYCNPRIGVHSVVLLRVSRIRRSCTMICHQTKRQKSVQSETLSSRCMRSTATSHLLPPLDDHIAVPRIKLKEPCPPARPFCRDHRGAGAAEEIEHDVPALR